MPFDSKLVVLGHSVTALAVARHARSLGIATFVADSVQGIAQRAAGVTAVDLNQTQVPHQLESLCRLGGPNSYLVSTADSWLRFLMDHRERLEASFAGILHPANATLEMCLSKRKFSVWCAENGFDAPRGFGVVNRETIAALTYPVMIRPDLTLHSAPRAELPKAREVRSADECRALLLRYEAAQVPPIATESLLVPGVIQYSVPFARAGGRVLSFCARKLRPSPDWCATGTYVEMCNAPAAERLARRAVEALDCYGIGEVEILHEPASGRDCLIEVNARPWVQYALAPASGHDFLSFTLSDGKDGGAARKNDLRWIDFRSDFYVCFSRDAGMVRHKHLSWGDYVKSVLSANVYAKFNRRDLAPYWADTVEWMRFLARGLRPG